MDASSKNGTPLSSGRQRSIGYALLALFLFGAALFQPLFTWQIDQVFHTYLELVATTLAFVIGGLAIVHYRAGQDKRYFFIALGFAGTAILDAFHLTATALPPGALPGSFDLLLPWSWLTSRVLLSVLLALSAFEDVRTFQGNASERLNESRAIVAVLAALVGTVLVFMFLPLPPVYFTDALISRPMDLFPVLLFGPALWWQFRSEAWRRDTFKHWLFISIILSVAIHLAYMPFSAQIGDIYFNLAHLLKILSYGAVLIGLGAGLARLVLDVEQSTDQLRKANAELQRQVSERKAAEQQAELLSSLVQNVSLGVTVLRLEDFYDIKSFRILTANPATEVMAQRPVTEMIGRTLAELYPGAMDLGLLEQYRDILLEGKLRDLGEIAYDQDGISGVFSILALPLDRDVIGIVADDITERKKAELALRRREEQLSEAQRLVRLGSWEWVFKDNSVSWSDEMFRIFGYEPGSVAISPEFYFSHIHDEDRPSIEAAVDYAIANKVPFTNYPRIVRQDGEVRVLHAQGNIELDENGEPRRMWGTAQDITERRRGEERLRQSELRLAQAQRLANVGHWDWDLATGRVSLSDQLARIFGREPRDGPMHFDDFIQMVHPDDRPMLQARIAKAQEEISQFTAQFRLIRLDGTERVLHAIGNVLGDESGQPMGLWGTGQDITEQQRVLNAVRESENKFRSVAQSANDAVISADDEGMIIFWNEAAAKTFGYSADEMIGHPMTEIMPEKYREAHRQGMARVRGGGEFRVVGQTVELEGLRRDGTVFPIELSLAAWEDAGLRYFTGILRDITERRRSQEAEAAFLARLEESNQELEEFAYIASHDLQEPLRKIRAFGGRLQRKYGDVLDDDGRDYLERMDSAASRMQALIDDLLALSRVTTRGQPFKQVDLNKTVAGVVSDLEVAAERVAGEVKIEPLPTIEADPLQMRQLFQNLISNGLKFHRPETPACVRIYSDKSDDESAIDIVRISVEDNGIGFDEKYLERIFQPFQRLHGRSKFEGTGIGLAICRKIVQRHGGQLTARSKPGVGSTFTITLPKRQRRQHARDE